MQGGSLSAKMVIGGTGDRSQIRSGWHLSLCTEFRLNHFFFKLFIYCKSTVLQQNKFFLMCENMWVSILGWINL